MHTLRLLSLILTLIAAATPVAAGVTNGGFELGAPDGSALGWNDSDSYFTFTRCSSGTCGTADGTAVARSGDYFAWLGGDASPQTALLTQTVFIPLNALALQFYFRAGSTGSGNASLNVLLGGNLLTTFNNANAPSYSNYTLISLPVLDYLGKSLLLEFQYSDSEDREGFTNWTLDDVSIPVNPIPEPVTFALTGAALAVAGLIRQLRV